MLAIRQQTVSVTLLCLLGLTTMTIAGATRGGSRNRKPARQTAAGDAKIQVRERVIPGDDSAPHDPVVDPQGHIWVTLQRANKVARLDVATGEWKFYAVPSANGRPHGLTTDRDGNIWFTENGTSKIGRVDARSGVVKEFDVPAAKDPHTPAFGPDGEIWFSSPNSNMILRLDPKSGETKLFPLPTPKATPNTVVAGPDGAIWFCEFGVNKLGRIDPASGSITEFTIPNESERPRRVVVSGQAIYYTDFGGRLGRFDVTSKQFKSWPSPSGTGSQPYGIGADGSGKIYYYEQATNKLIRFDPTSEKFDVVLMPTEKSNVVAMTRDAKGRVWMALSGVNKVATIE